MQFILYLENWAKLAIEHDELLVNGIENGVLPSNLYWVRQSMEGL